MPFAASRAKDVAVDLQASNSLSKGIETSCLTQLRIANISLRCPATTLYNKDDAADRFRMTHFPNNVLLRCIGKEVILLQSWRTGIWHWKPSSNKTLMLHYFMQKQTRLLEHYVRLSLSNGNASFHDGTALRNFLCTNVPLWTRLTSTVHTMIIIATKSFHDDICGSNQSQEKQNLTN